MQHPNRNVLQLGVAGLGSQINARCRCCCCYCCCSCHCRCHVATLHANKCSTHSHSHTHTHKQSGNTKTRTLTRWCPHVSARAFICRFRFRLSSSASSLPQLRLLAPLDSGPAPQNLQHRALPAPRLCGQLQSSDCALISCCCCCKDLAHLPHVMHLEISRISQFP